jgi:hypothetical protein
MTMAIFFHEGLWKPPNVVVLKDSPMDKSIRSAFPPLMDLSLEPPMFSAADENPQPKARFLSVPDGTRPAGRPSHRQVNDSHKPTQSQPLPEYGMLFATDPNLPLFGGPWRTGTREMWWLSRYFGFPYQVWSVFEARSTPKCFGILNRQGQIAKWNCGGNCHSPGSLVSFEAESRATKCVSRMAGIAC